MDKSTELLMGLLEMPILKAVSLGPLHGYGRLESLSSTLSIHAA